MDDELRADRRVSALRRRAASVDTLSRRCVVLDVPRTSADRHVAAGGARALAAERLAQAGLHPRPHERGAARDVRGYRALRLDRPGAQWAARASGAYLRYCCRNASTRR